MVGGGVTRFQSWFDLALYYHHLEDDTNDEQGISVALGYYE